MSKDTQTLADIDAANLPGEGRRGGWRGFVDRYIVTDREFYKKALVLIIPVVLQNIINQGVNMMDTIMVGKLGEASISASSLANQYYQIYQLLCMGISAAGLVLASQYWGAGERDSVRGVFDLVMRIVLVVGTVFALVTISFPRQIMGIYSNEHDVIEEGAGYLRITALIFLPHGLSLVAANVVRALRNARLGLLTSAISFAVNVACNYIFIFGKLGLPAMGVMGAALGTLCARVVELTVCAVYLFKFEKELKYRPWGIVKRPKSGLLREFKRLGLPAVISDTILGLASSAISVILGHMGKQVVSAYAIVTVMDRVCTVATMGVASAAGVIVGQTVGEGDFDRAKREGHSFFFISAAIGVFSAALVLIVGGWTVSLYKITDATRDIAMAMMDVSAIIVFFMSVQSTLSKGVLRGGGDTRFLMVADVIFQWCASIPLGALVGLVLKWPPYLALIALRIDYIIKAVWLFFRLRSGKWIHRAKNA